MSILIDGTGNDITLNGVSVTTDAESSAALALKAPLASPAFTGTPTAPTQTAGDSSTKVATTQYVDRKMTLMTAQNSTSGVSIDFTGIPSWVKRVTVMFNGVSTSGASIPMVQLGTSGWITTSGYLGAAWTDGGSAINHSVGFLIAQSHAATTVFHGQMTLCLLGSNTWTETSRNALSNAAILLSSAGSVTLLGTLDRIRITTVNGTDAFDAGSINVMYEG